MQVYEGIVQDRVIVLPDGIQLEDGLRVEIRIHEPRQEAAEELFKQRLVERGLIETIKRPSLQLRTQDRTPIEVKGQPLSEQVIEDRR